MFLFGIYIGLPKNTLIKAGVQSYFFGDQEIGEWQQTKWWIQMMPSIWSGQDPMLTCRWSWPGVDRCVESICQSLPVYQVLSGVWICNCAYMIIYDHICIYTCIQTCVMDIRSDPYPIFDPPTIYRSLCHSLWHHHVTSPSNITATTCATQLIFILSWQLRPSICSFKHFEPIKTNKKNAIQKNSCIVPQKKDVEHDSLNLGIGPPPATPVSPAAGFSAVQRADLQKLSRGIDHRSRICGWSNGAWGEATFSVGRCKTNMG